MKFYKTVSIIKKLFCVYLSTLLMITCCSLNLTAFAYDENFSYLDVKEVYENTTISVDNLIDNMTEEEKIFLDNSYKGNIIYNNIMNYIENNNDIFSQSFGGAYTNTDGNLVILLTGDIDYCKEKLTLEFNYANPIIEVVSYSYKDLKAELDSINDKIGALVEKKNNGLLVDEEEIRLLDAYPRTSIDIENNAISICLSEDSIATDSSVVAYSRNNANSKLISEFEAFANTSEMVEISTDKKYKPVELQSDTCRPGQPIRVSVGLLSYSLCSSGYRAKYNYNGTTYTGFVTCGHGNEVGKTVYLELSSTSKVKIGKILDRVLADNENTDVAFIRLTNDDYTPSNAIYYTSSQAGVTSRGTILDGTQTTVSTGSRIYKSGRTTYLTSATVVSTSASEFVAIDEDTVYYYKDMIKTTAMTDSGDSGGVAYIVGTGATSGKAVGIVTAGDGATISLFTKASNIKNDFGPYAY